MQFGDFLEDTGLTHRRFFRWIDYFDDWYETPYEKTKITGREYNPAVVRKVALLVQVSEAFGGKLPMAILVAIYENYDEGFYRLGEGVTIEWSP